MCASFTVKQFYIATIRCDANFQENLLVSHKTIITTIFLVLSGSGLKLILILIALFKTYRSDLSFCFPYTGNKIKCFQTFYFPPRLVTIVDH